MALKDWKRKNGSNYVIFTNKKDNSLTYEIHKLPDDEIEEGSEEKYYCFPAQNGKGIPSSPDFAETISDGIKLAKDYMRSH